MFGRIIIDTINEKVVITNLSKQSLDEMDEEDEFEELWELFGPKSAEYVASVNRSERQAYWQQLAMMAFDTKIRQTAEHAVELYGRRK